MCAWQLISNHSGFSLDFDVLTVKGKTKITRLCYGSVILPESVGVSFIFYKIITADVLVRYLIPDADL